jgi:drug/metabolite transporter (DMT)-like permease
LLSARRSHLSENTSLSNLVPAFPPRSKARRARLLGVACAIGSVLLFSSFTLVSRLGFSSPLRPADIVTLRFGVGGSLLLPIFLRHRLHGVRWRDALGLAFLGGIGFATLAYSGFYLAPAAHGSVFLHGTLTPITYVILLAAGRQPAYRVLGISLIAGGALLMAFDGGSAFNTRQLCGDGLLLLASASWSAYGIRARAVGLPPARAASIVAVLSMCVVLPLYAISPDKGLASAAVRDLFLQVFVQGVLIGAVSIFMYTYAVASLGAAETSLFTAAVPCLTTLGAIPLLGESPSKFAIAGVGFVTLGMLIAPRTKPKRQVATAPPR